MVSAATALGQLRETKDALEGQLTEERALLAEFQRRTRDMKQRCASLGIAGMGRPVQRIVCRMG